MSAEQPTDEEYAAKFLVQQIVRVAGQLRRLAETVEDHAARVARVPGRSNYGSVAYEVQHDVAWALANMWIPGLTQAAYDADYARLTATPPASDASPGGEAR